MSTSDWEPPSPGELQTLLPQYEIKSILGRGGMGAVYRGRQAKLDRDVAIKLLPETFTSGPDELNYVKRFEQEARAMARLDHPAIITVFDFGETPNGQLYFVMEFVDGMDIREYLREQGGILPQGSALAIVAHVLDALAYAHANGIIHRDIKPANILLNREGRVKIADFGLAKRFGEHSGDDASALTMSNVAVGTPVFVAPEALEGGVPVDHRADLYAVGVMLYQLLTGKLPRGHYAAPTQLNPGLDPRFDLILAKAMQSDPSQRYDSAEALRLDLDAILTGPVPRIEAGEDSLAAAAAVPVDTILRGRKRAAPKKVKAGSSSASIAAAVGVVVLAGVGYLIANRSGGGEALPMAAKDRLIEPGTEGAVARTELTSRGDPAKATKESPFVNSLGMKFVPVPGTAVLFGVHEVRHSDYFAFWKEHSHLNADWKNQTHDGFVIGESPGDHPVANVSWDDATAFTAWLSKREGLHYRLPTDREWSIAVGIGGYEKWEAETTPATVFKPQDVFPWSKDWPPPPGSGNYSDASRQRKAFRADAQYVEGGYDDGFPTTSPVMSFPANSFGLHDLGGNVWEWCEDWASSERKERVLRGGSWYRGEPGLMLSSYRGRYAPSDRRLNGGFRVVLEPAPNLNSPPIPAVGEPLKEGVIELTVP